MTSSLADRIAIVTGASAGIGWAIAQDLVAHGARVVVNGRRAEKLRDAAERLNALGRPNAAVAVPGDAAEQSTIDAMFEAAARAFGAEADLVVVNAGRGLSGSVVTSDPGEWEEMIRTNLLGAARLMRTAAERMTADLEKRDGGKWQSRARDIVALGSVVGRHVSPYSSMYGSTKFGVHGLAEGLRRELSPKGIRVTLIEPGFVVSEFQGVAGYKDEWFKGVVEKIGPVLRPEDVARVISFACSQPPYVHVGDVLVRPTRQEYP
jgi:NADP-dependent 3-hydroxy acid dehydrogenase YdfG